MRKNDINIKNNKSLISENILKKKGFTLIEVIVAISILGCIVCIGSIGIKNIGKFNKSTKIHYYHNKIASYINCCREYCKTNCIDGKVIYDEEHNEFKFKIAFDEISLLKLSNEIKCSTNLSEDTLIIARDGVCSNCGTITIKILPQTRDITICVGSDYVRVK
ncbi:type II secretion system protein [Haloimpatiens sp. FM7330]|uniref:type II secretion system protein n=1 Tax=Haloimpatiens sp. FM7330 TaxID=3298610 RepID=UPI0036420FA0